MIEVIDLSKSYAKNQQILSNVCIKLDDNRIHFLMGKNGSGKTTFLKCLLGLEGYEGCITFGGKPVHRIQDRLFAIFDDVPLYDNLNGYQNIRLLLEDSGTCDPKKIEELSLLSSHKLRKRVKDYSLGEKKKLALIAALLQKPKYLFIDEISNGLDAETLEILQENLKKLKKESLILVTGHHFDFYEKIIDELYIIRDNTITHIIDYAKGGETLHDFYRKYLQNH